MRCPFAKMHFLSLMRLAFANKAKSYSSRGSPWKQRKCLKKHGGWWSPADVYGNGEMCDEYRARIQAALARCQMESADSKYPKKSKEALQQMRQALPNDGLNPYAHLDFAKALISSLGLEFCQNQANWLDERYIEAHYHVSVACALKRADKRVEDRSIALPASFKKVFGDLGDDGGWKRVIFCASQTAICSRLHADEAASALTNRDFQKKKAIFVLLHGSYTLSMSMTSCHIDIYGTRKEGAAAI